MSDTHSQEPKGAIAKFLAASPDSVGKTIFVAVAVCLVASMVVSASAVSLRPAQEGRPRGDRESRGGARLGRIGGPHRCLRETRRV